jgi:spermidine export protein MdtJ
MKKQYALIAVLLVIEVLGQTALKRHINTNVSSYYWLGFACYIAVAFFFHEILKEETLVVANSLWQISNLVIIALVSTFLFQESIDSTQIIGIALGVVAIYLVQ